MKDLTPAATLHAAVKIPQNATDLVDASVLETWTWRQLMDNAEYARSIAVSGVAALAEKVPGANPVEPYRCPVPVGQLYGVPESWTHGHLSYMGTAYTSTPVMHQIPTTTGSCTIDINPYIPFYGQISHIAMRCWTWVNGSDPPVGLPAVMPQLRLARRLASADARTALTVLDSVSDTSATWEEYGAVHFVRMDIPAGTALLGNRASNYNYFLEINGESGTNSTYGIVIDRLYVEVTP
jgi:hypothetical protein